MLRINEIKNALKNLVGWYQSTNPSYEIDAGLLDSESGLFFQDAHPLLTLDNISSILPKHREGEYREYSSAETYHKGSIVLYNDIPYICLQTSTDNEPTDDSYWKQYDQLSHYLKSCVDAGISTVVNNFITTKTLNKETKAILEHKCLFDGAGRKQNTIANSGRDTLVGFELQPLKGLGVTTQLHRIGMQFVGGNGVVHLFLFHTSQAEPIATFDLEYTANGSYKWFNVENVFMRYIDEYGVGGTYYICYNQDELPSPTMMAVNVNKDWSKEPCSSCNLGDARTWRAMVRHMRVSPFRVDVDDWDAENPTMFSTDDIIYTHDKCYGLNIEFSIGCDLTDFIVAQRTIFAVALQKQVAVDVLRRIAYNPDAVVNRNQANVSRQELIAELDGNTYTKSSGLKGELKKAYDSIELETTKMDSACLSCSTKGVKYTLA